MKPSTIVSIFVLLILTGFYCGELPLDPLLDPSNASVKLFVKGGGDLMVNRGEHLVVGLEMDFMHLMDAVTITSGCGNIDTTFALDISKKIDSLYFDLLFEAEGKCVIKVQATMQDKELKDRSDSLSILIYPERPGIAFAATPPVKEMVVGNSDTLLFITRALGGVTIPPAYTMTVLPVENASAFVMEYSLLKDTVRVIASPDGAGEFTITLVATAEHATGTFSDTATVTLTAKDRIAPAVVDAPENVVAGKADTLLFAVDNSTRPDSLTIALITDVPLNPQQFTIVPSGPDSILIAVAATALPTGETVNMGIVTSNGMVADTSWYPVTIVGADAALWNTSALAVEATEGTPFTLDCKQYLSEGQAEGVVITSDVGTVSDDNVWSFTPAWGAEPSGSAEITARKGEVSLSLALAITVIPADTTPPLLLLADPAVDGKVVGSPSVTIECMVTDSEAGVGAVVMTYGTETVPAILQQNSIYSAIISGLPGGAPVQITITATDRSIKRNKTAKTVTVTYDPAVPDGEGPAVRLTSGQSSGDRVKTAEGVLEYAVTDISGIDSVWWTLGGNFVGALQPVDDVYTIAYTLTTFGENVIAIHARDASAKNNSSKVEITLNYNTVPSAPVLTAPQGSEEGVGETPTFTWSGGSDADGDTVFYRVLYRKSTDVSFTATEEVTAKTYVLPAAEKLSPLTVYNWKVLGYSKTFADTLFSAENTFTTYNPTAADMSAPVIAQTAGPATGARVKDGGGSLAFSVSDQSGVDSVWWTLNGVFAGTLQPAEGVYAVSYALATFGENVIALHARDASVNSNSSKVECMLNYNTVPSAPVLTAPQGSEEGVGETPTFTWSGGSDADGDTVFYRVLYRKSVDLAFTTTAEVTEKSYVVPVAEKLTPFTVYIWKVLGYSKTFPDTLFSAEGTFTTFDPTAEDIAGPKITQASGATAGSRVKESKGTLTFTVTDQSGIDSVRWELNGVPIGYLPPISGVYSVDYTLQAGSNVVSVIASDKATSKNRDTLSVALVYNTLPTPSTVLTLLPADGATAVATTPAFKWRRVSDAEGDKVYYRVLYGSSAVTLDKQIAETQDTAAALAAANKLAVLQQYYWQVIAYTKTPYADTVRSEIASFTTAGVAAKIVTQPKAPAAVYEDGDVTLEVAAEGTPAPTYQWYKGTAPLTGKNSAKLTLSGVTSASSGTYHVVVKNSAGPEVKSDVVTIAVKEKVAFTTDPKAQIIGENELVTFTVDAKGEPKLTYQWQKNRLDIDGENSASYTIDPVTTALNGALYRCIVSNAFSKDTSKEAKLTVTATPVHKVEFNTDGGSIVTSQNIKEGERAKMPATDPIKAGYEFKGWFISKISPTEFDFSRPITGQRLCMPNGLRYIR